MSLLIPSDKEIKEKVEVAMDAALAKLPLLLTDLLGGKEVSVEVTLKLKVKE